MQDIIFTKYSTDRAEEFKIRTDIIKNENGRLIVKKSAFTSDAEKHIDRIYKSYEALSSFYKDTIIRINECKPANHALEFPFIAGKTFEEILDSTLEEGKAEEVINKIEQFCALLRESAHKNFVCTKEFNNIFGQVTFDQDTLFVNVADVDMLFANIIVNDYWNIIDYEWTFLFDVPVDFIIYRSVSKYISGTLYTGFRDELQHFDIWKRLNITEDDVKLYQQMEANFYRYVNGNTLTRTEMQKLVGKPVISVRDRISEFQVESEKRNIQVFFDFGEGFVEEGSILISPDSNNRKSIKTEIQIPQDCIAVRIDPMSGFGFFQLDKIQIDDQNADYDINGVRMSNGVVIFYNEDPQIIVNHTLHHKIILLEGQVVFTEACVPEGVFSKFDEMQADVKELLDSNSKLRDNNSSLQNDISNITEEKRKLSQNVLELQNNINEFNKEKVLLEDEISKKNNHIDNLQVKMYQTEMERQALELRCSQLELELNQSIFIRLLKSNKVTYKAGRFLKFIYQNGFKATGRLISMKIKTRFGKRFYKSPLEIHSAATVTGDNVKPILELPEIEEITKKIAVHLHLFYMDLLPEFIWYLNNIPFGFDLFISCQYDAPVKKIRKMVKKIKNVDKVIIKKCPNRGRDIAPLYVWFGEEISNYDYFLHMHTKKSLYTGSEKIGWRQMSLDCLLGSEEIIKKIFCMLETDPKIGLVYPEYYSDFCKFHCSWLTNDIIGREFLDRLNIEQDKMMFCYPAGSFFWARTESIKPLFEMKLTIEDFPEEQGQVDTTLAHVLERAVACVAEDRGYIGTLIDLEEGVIRLRRSFKLFRDYVNYKVEDVIDILKIYDTISFDIFGTLVTSKAYNRTTLFQYIQKNHPDLAQADYDFVKERKGAEKTAVKKYGDSTTLLNIYECMAEKLSLNNDEAKQFADYENEAVIELSIPRKDMKHLYESMRYRNKKLILIEDTYYSRQVIDKILEKCGYSDYDELWISNEIGKRKDKNELWDDFYEKFSDSSLIHVGDNPRSDWQTVYDRGKNAFWVMNGYDEFCMSKYYDDNYNLFNGNYDDALKLGELINEKLFNSPFALKGSEGNELKE